MKQKVSVPGEVKNFIFKYDEFTFTLYHHSLTLINVTGVKCFDRLTIAEKIIEEKLQQNVLKVRIDNTFYSQKNYRNVDLNKLYTFMQVNRLFHADYKLFAGIFLHPKQKDYPTILFFRTGSYTMMGDKPHLNFIG